MEEEDDVVEEIPILLGPSREWAQSRLYVAHMGLRLGKGSRPLKSLGVSLRGRFRPTSQRLQLSLPLPSGPALDAHKASALGGDEVLSTQHLEGSLLEGSELAGAYALAQIVDGSLILEPVDGIIQLRHSFAYLEGEKEAGGGVGASSSGAGAETGSESGGASDSETEARSVQVRFSRESLASRRKRAAEAAASSEPWLPIRFRSHSHPDDDADADAAQLAAELKRLSPQQPKLQLASSQLLQAFIPKAKDDWQGTENLPSSSALSLAQLRELPLQEQVRRVLRSAHAVPFSSLRRLLGVETGSEGESSLLSLLSEDAALVLGVWVLKSHLVYPDHPPNSSARSRVGPDPSLMRKARDLIIYRLLGGEPISGKEMAASVRLAPDHLAELLAGLTEHRPGHGYVFPYAEDVAFMEAHPLVVKEQKQLWETRWGELEPWLRQNAAAAVAHPPSSTQRGRTKTASARRRSRLSSHSASAHHQPSTSSKAGEKRKRAASGDRSKTPSTTAAMDANGVSAATAKTEAAEVSAEAKAELRRFVYNCLTERFVMGAEEASVLLAARQLESSGDGPLTGIPTPLSPSLFAEAASEAGAKAVTGKEGLGLWLWSGGGGRWPEAREFTLNWLTTRCRFRPKTFREALSKALPDPTSVPPEPELKALLFDYCILDKGTFVLRGSHNPPSSKNTTA